jgi:hypothetical protein
MNAGLRPICIRVEISWACPRYSVVALRNNALPTNALRLELVNCDALVSIPGDANARESEPDNNDRLGKHPKDAQLFSLA